MSNSAARRYDNPTVVTQALSYMGIIYSRGERAGRP